MESYDLADKGGTPLFELTIDSIGKEYLRKAAKWAKFLAIFMLVLIGIYLLVLLVGLTSGNSNNEFSPDNYPTPSMYMFAYSGRGVFVAAIIILAIYIFPAVFLLQFSTRTLRALEADDQAVLTDSLHSLKRFFQFLGILVIIVVSLVIIGFILLFMAMGMR